MPRFGIAGVAMARPRIVNLLAIDGEQIDHVALREPRLPGGRADINGGIGLGRRHDQLLVLDRERGAQGRLAFQSTRLQAATVWSFEAVTNHSPRRSATIALTSAPWPMKSFERGSSSMPVRSFRFTRPGASSKSEQP